MQEEMSGESVVSSAVPAAATRTTSFKGTSPSSKYVKLNIGGALYYTTMQTLTKQDTMLKAMFSGRMEVLTDSEGKGATCIPRTAPTGWERLDQKLEKREKCVVVGPSD